MNHYDIYDYIRKLHYLVETQNNKIKQLESLVMSLNEDVTTLKNKPSIQVDRIEYKFDQLKVETLEGTLNIGLNPTDLQGIEDFAVDGKQPNITYPNPANSFQNMMRTEEALINDIDPYVDELIRQYESNTQISIADSYSSFIKEDIKKQLSNRIHYHLSQIPMNQRTNEQETEKMIIEMIRHDIANGVKAFLDNLPRQ
jgi:spore germination protein PC